MASPERTHRNDGLEAQARADLAAGRWRKARDAFKELCRRDRATFQPLLVEANVGLARALLAKRQVSDAKQIVAYLKTIAPAATVAALAREIADASTTAPAAEGPPAADPLVLLADGLGSPAERVRWADDLVVAFGPPSSNEANQADPERAAPREQIAKDLAVIRHALEAVCAGHVEQALDLVRPLRRESPFAHWRLFIRAIAAYQSGDAEKAKRAFRELPRDSVPGRARDAWLLALGDGTGMSRPASEPLVEAATTIAGHAGWGRALARADALWRSGKHSQSYRALRDARPSFPAGTPDLGGALSDFYFNSVFGMREDDREQYETYLFELEADRRVKAPERQFVRRALALLLAKDFFHDEIDELRALWEAFLREHQRVHGADPRLASIGWAWLGHVLARPMPSPFSRAAAKPIAPEAAVGALAKAIEIDPSNASAHVLLADLYKTLRRTRDRNRLLDVMAARFPNEKAVLVAAGVGCLERRAFGKAANYFERALTLDRLDPTTPDYVASARLALARQDCAKGRLEKARAALDGVDALAVDSATNLVRGKWTLAARRGVLESMYGDAASAAAAISAAREQAPSLAQFALFARLAWSFYDRAKPYPAALEAEWDRAASHQPSAREGAELVPVMRYWAQAGDSRVPQVAVRWLTRYLGKAARVPFTREEAARLIEHLRPWRAFHEVVLMFVRHILKADGADPLFRLYDVLLQPFQMLSPDQCEEILAEARRRGDAVAERLGREVLGELPSFDEGVDPFDDENVADFDESFPDDADLDSFVEHLSTISDAELAVLRKLRPKDMPSEVFEAIVALARGHRPAPLPRAQTPAKRPRDDGRRKPVDKPAPDPNQPDLF